MNKCKHCEITSKELGSKKWRSTTECRVCYDGLRRYNLNRNEQLKWWEASKRRCGCCRKELEMFNAGKGGAIDHDHETGEVRGVLCISCNRAMNVDFLEQAHIYLSGRWKCDT